MADRRDAPWAITRSRLRHALRAHGADVVRLAVALQISFQAAAAICRAIQDATGRAIPPGLDLSPAPAVSQSAGADHSPVASPLPAPSYPAAASQGAGRAASLDMSPGDRAGNTCGETSESRGFSGGGAFGSRPATRLVSSRPVGPKTDKPMPALGGRGVLSLEHDQPVELRRQRRDQVTEEERRAIDEAVAAGRVTRVAFGAVAEKPKWRPPKRSKWRLQLQGERGNSTRERKRHVG